MTSWSRRLRHFPPQMLAGGTAELEGPLTQMHLVPGCSYGPVLNWILRGRSNGYPPLVEMVAQVGFAMLFFGFFWHVFAMIADMRGFIFNGPGDVPMLKYKRITCFFSDTFCEECQETQGSNNGFISIWGYFRVLNRCFNFQIGCCLVSLTIQTCKRTKPMPQTFLLDWVEPNKLLLAGVMNQTVARDRVGQGRGAPQSAWVIVDRDTFWATSRCSESNKLGREKSSWSIWKMLEMCINIWSGFSFYVDALLVAWVSPRLRNGQI